MANKIILRRDTAANWTNANPVLSNGEIGLETDTERFKIGNGIQGWSDRAYYANAQTIANEYATLLNQKVADAQEQVELAEAEVAKAAAHVATTESYVQSAANKASEANTYANNAANSASDAEYYANQASALDDDAMLAVINDNESQARLRLNQLYAGGGSNVEYCYVAYGTPPANGGIHTVGWHRAGEGVSTYNVNDPYKAWPAPTPEWMDVSFLAGEEGKINLDVSEAGIYYMVDIRVYIEDAMTSIYPNGSTWALGYSDDFNQSGPRDYVVRTKSAQEIQVSDAMYTDIQGASPWFTLRQQFFGTPLFVLPWVYVPVDTSTSRQFFTNVHIMRFTV